MTRCACAFTLGVFGTRTILSSFTAPSSDSLLNFRALASARGLALERRPPCSGCLVLGHTAAAQKIPREGLRVPRNFHGTFHLPPKVLLGLFVLVDTGQALAMDWAEKRNYDTQRTGRQYARQSVLVCHGLLAISSGFAAAAYLNGWAGLMQCLDFRLFLNFLPVSLFFATGLSLKMMAVDHFHAGTIKIVGQLRLPAVALMSTLLLGRHYSIVKWQVIGAISTSCLCFVVLKGQRRVSQGKPWKWTGLSQIFGWVMFNVIGGIVAEHRYKSGNMPFYAQKVAEDFGHLLIALIALLLVVPRFQPEEDICDRKLRPGGFFDGWDFRTFVVVGFLFLDAWVGNLLLKEFSGVTRSIAKAFAVSVVYLVSLVYSQERRNNPSLSLVALLVVQCSILYAFVT